MNYISFTLWLSSMGIFSQAIFPLEVVRRRIQLGESSGVLSMMKVLSLKELFGGLSATYLKVIPAASVSLLIRDALLGRLNQD